VKKRRYAATDSAAIALGRVGGNVARDRPHAGKDPDVGPPSGVRRPSRRALDGGPKATRRWTEAP